MIRSLLASLAMVTVLGVAGCGSGGGGDGTVVATDFTPLHGDFDGIGTDAVGLYDPATGAFFLKNSNAPGAADLAFTFGAGGGAFVPLAGDWDGNGGPLRPFERHVLLEEHQRGRRGRRRLRLQPVGLLPVPVGLRDARDALAGRYFASRAGRNPT